MAQIERVWEKQVWTARSQLQVLDGIMTYVAKNDNEAIDHLVRMTRVMSDLYKVRAAPFPSPTLHVITRKGANRTWI